MIIVFAFLLFLTCLGLYATYLSFKYPYVYGIEGKLFIILIDVMMLSIDVGQILAYIRNS